MYFILTYYGQHHLLIVFCVICPKKTFMGPQRLTPSHTLLLSHSYVFYLIKATTAKYYGLSGLNKENLYLMILETGRKAEIREAAWWGCGGS